MCVPYACVHACMHARKQARMHACMNAHIRLWCTYTSIHWFWLTIIPTNFVRGLSNKEIKFQNKGTVSVQIAPLLLSQPRNQNQSIRTCMHTYIHTCLHTFIMYMYILSYMYERTFICTYVCVCVCMYAHIWMCSHLHLFPSWSCMYPLIISRCNILQHTATHCNTLQHALACICSSFYMDAQMYAMHSWADTCKSVLQCAAVCCSMLQYVATWIISHECANVCNALTCISLTQFIVYNKYIRYFYILCNALTCISLNQFILYISYHHFKCTKGRRMAHTEEPIETYYILDMELTYI